MQTSERSFILSVDSFAGRDDAVIKSLDDFRPRGVAGVTTLSNGQIVLILDMKELLADLNAYIDREIGAKPSRLWRDCCSAAARTSTHPATASP